jgi:transcriptional regulator with XRE-family HTH domain
VPKPQRGYPLAPRTIGDHIKAARLDRSLTQKEVATDLGVSPFNVNNWELNRYPVADRFVGKVARWLGYAPLPPESDLPALVASRRRLVGLSRKRLARAASVDEETVARLERGLVRPASPAVATLLATLHAMESDSSSAPRPPASRSPDSATMVHLD